MPMSSSIKDMEEMRWRIWLMSELSKKTYVTLSDLRLETNAARICTSVLTRVLDVLLRDTTKLPVLVALPLPTERCQLRTLRTLIALDTPNSYVELTAVRESWMSARRVLLAAPGVASKVSASLHASVVGNKRDARTLLKAAVGDLVGDSGALKVYHMSAADFSTSRLSADESLVSHAFLVDMCCTQEASRRGIELDDMVAKSRRFELAVNERVRSPRARAASCAVRTLLTVSSCRHARSTGEQARAHAVEACARVVAARRIEGTRARLHREVLSPVGVQEQNCRRRITEGAHVPTAQTLGDLEEVL
jgi:hypothetical protein